MLRAALFLSGLWMLAGTVPAQLYDHFHDRVYLGGGYGVVSTTVPTRGVHLYRMAPVIPPGGTATTLFIPAYYSYGHQMDHDNQCVVFTVETSPPSPTVGPHAGVYRYDPSASRYQTVVGPDTMTLYQPAKIVVNQDGDYVFGCYQRRMVGSTVQYDYAILKATQAGKLSTVLSSASLGRRAYFNHHIGIDIDSGHYLVVDSSSHSSLSFTRGILEVSDAGVVNTWSTGGNYGWYGLYSAPQNHRNGYLEGIHGDYVYQLKPGTTGRTTLARLAVPFYIYGGSDFDLQTAASPRWVALGYLSGVTQPDATYFYHVDRATFAVTSFVMINRPYRTYNYDFDFVGGRHIQTVLQKPRVWEICLSCPRFAGKAYVLAAGMSGVRPGLALPDGRNINLNPDGFTFLTLNNLVPTLFQPGPGVLDRSGQAQGRLDLSAIPWLDLPLWIAMAVIDPAGPLGFAYLPDTYVMRI